MIAKCKNCGQIIDHKDKVCPHCGTKDPSTTKTMKAIIWIAGLAFAAWILVPSDGSHSKGVSLGYSENSDHKSEWLKKAEEDLTVLYINRKIYDGVRCDSKKIEEKHIINCHAPLADSMTPGGLFLAVHTSGYDSDIYALNGKASQHTEHSFVQPYTKDDISVIKILDIFYPKK